MADWDFAKATTWAELQRVHDKWVEAYLGEEHWAHRQRPDGKRSPGAVLNWVIGTPHDPDALARLFAPVRAVRTLDRAGYVRFRRWRLYSNRALARHHAHVWLSEETLTIASGEEPLAYYTVTVNRRGELTAVTEPRLLPTPYQAPQPPLWSWTAGSDEWLLALRLPARGRRRRRRRVGVQGWLCENADP